jgi:transcriptional regulator GlxA family with amidase domain
VRLAGSRFYSEISQLARPDPRQRVWQLSPDQVESFKWLFLQILNEHTHRRSQRLIAESAWLRLLLVSVQRWAEGQTLVASTPAGIGPDVVRLWHLVNACVGNPAEFLKEIHQMSNYDSLRHSFKNAFGYSPREMMLRLRIQQAKNLLLETQLSVKEIAVRVGYQRQHEFARAFKQDAGIAPSEWRTNPFQSSITV